MRSMRMSFEVEEFGALTLLVSLHTAEAPRDEWLVYERRLRELKRVSKGEFQRLRVLVVSDGGAPDTQQRNTMQNEIWEGQAVKVSVLTNSLQNPIVRGVAKALSWMNPGFKICNPSDLPGALVHLGLLHELDRSWECLRRLQAGMPTVATLGLIADALGRPRLTSSR
jgi:hypothetical protein